MSENLTVYVTVRLEYFARHFVRARPLGPWKVQAVGASADEVLGRIRGQLSKALSKSLPSSFHEVNLPGEYDQWLTQVLLKPQERSLKWEEQLKIELQSFRWELPNGKSYVLIPAIHCSLFGKTDELSDAEVNNQAQIALNRMAEDRDLLELQDRFSGRTYEFQRLPIEVQLNPEAEEQDEKKAERRKTATLRSSASDLTIARLPDVYGLDEKATEVADYFATERSQSVLLMGAAGVGKTSLVHRLVRMREALGLGDRKIWSTSGARIVSGMSGLGMWQERCAKMIKQAHETNAILHLGSLFELMEAGKIDGSPGVASMIRHAISRRRLTAIAECTPEQLAIVEREDPLLVRSFIKYEIEEPKPEWTADVLRQAADSLYANEPFAPEAIEELVRLHTRFATYSALPATALRLMRTMTEQPREAWDETPIKQAHDVARAFARQSGLPQFLVDDSITLDLAKVQQKLSRNVIGQEEPVELIVSLIATLKARLVRPGKPLASLMFIGPTGVGKTEMAKAIARLLYSDTKRMIRIDMSEYSSPWSVAKLIGKPGEGDGALTSPIREQPFSVVLLDEFEKADPNVFDLLLQVLGEGRLTDSQGRLADFRNAVVIMTSNLGAETFREDGVGFGGSSADWSEHFEREVKRFVRPEFLGRIDRIVPFQALPRDVVREIAHREIELLKQRAGFKYGDADLSVQPEAIERLCELGYQPKYGARPLRRAIEENVVVPLANKIGELASQQSSWSFNVDLREGDIAIDATAKSGPTDSQKEQESRVFDSWQKLGAMARCAEQSAPVRKLENTMERQRRQAETTRQKLEAAEKEAARTSTHSRRAVKLKEKLLRLEGEVEGARKIRARLFEVIEEICETQLNVNLDWHQCNSLEVEQLQDSRQTYLSLLRQAVEDVVKGRSDDSKQVVMMVVGRGGKQLEILYRAYQMLADQNRWSIDKYVMKPYDPLLDKESAEYRKRLSERKQNLLESTEQPTLRLPMAKNSEGTPELACDLFRYPDDEFSQRIADCSGFVLRLAGAGISSWLENEHGTYHFFDPNQAGSKRRSRYRVAVSTDRLTEHVLPINWQETTSDPERDPRRTFNLEQKTLNDGILGASKTYAQGKESEVLFECMVEEHEASLWRAVGYHGIPANALVLADEVVSY